MWHIWIKNINHMKKLSVASVVCAVVAGIMGGNHASAQTLAVQLQADNYNPTTGVWADSSGNGNNGTYGKVAGTTGAQVLPTLATGVTPNGSDAVSISAGNGSFLLNTSLAYSSGYTVLAYVLPTNTSGRHALTGGSAGYALEYDIYNGNQDFLQEYQNDVAHGTATVPTSGFSLLDLAVAGGPGSANSFDFNSQPDASSSPGGSGAGLGSNLTRIGNNEGGGDGFVGDIAEIDIYTGVLTPTQIANDEAAINTAYAVPEPTTLALMAGGIGALVATRRMRRN